jgi:uncharacterized protein (TIGR02453 family)
MGNITKENLSFLNALAKNNDRDWFTENKPEYQQHHEAMVLFADALLGKMNQHDNIETLNGKKSLHRIYRDVRFSKDKSPYKSHWGGGFKRATKQLRGGYYYHIQPNGNSFVGGGFWGPNKEDLLRIREDISMDASDLREIITSPEFVDTFGQLKGEQLKSSPKGFDKEHPDIDLLRYKQFIVMREFTNKEILAGDFIEKVNATFMKMRPLFDYMSDVLTTDINGSPLL